MDHGDPWKPHPRLKHVAMQWCSCSAEQGTRSVRAKGALSAAQKKTEVLCKLIMQTFRGPLLWVVRRSPCPESKPHERNGAGARVAKPPTSKINNFLEHQVQEP